MIAEFAVTALAAVIALLVTAPGRPRRQMAMMIMIYGLGWYLAIRPALLGLIG